MCVCVCVCVCALTRATLRGESCVFSDSVGCIVIVGCTP